MRGRDVPGAGSPEAATGAATAGRPGAALARLAARIVRCRRCPRLVAHREAVAATPPRRYRGQAYWAGPVTGFGDPRARLLLVGLAPAAHGGNRTGRIFTGDRSGDWLYRALWEAGFASQPTAVSRDDGLVLSDAWVTAAARCAPPGNRPTPEEIARCRPYLLEELRALDRVEVVVGLGRIGWEAYLAARRALGRAAPAARPVFAHGAVARLDDGVALIASYHPSQQNTFTGRLTPEMFRAIFATARGLLEGRLSRPGRPAGGGARRRSARPRATDRRARS